jgi:hypothetical protein
VDEHIGPLVRDQAPGALAISHVELLVGDLGRERAGRAQVGHGHALGPLASSKALDETAAEVAGASGDQVAQANLRIAVDRVCASA